MSGTNLLFAALSAANPLWDDLGRPFSLDPGTAYHIGSGAPLGAFFITDGIACTTYGKTVVGLSGPGDCVGYHGLMHDTPSPIMTFAETPSRGIKVMTKSCRRIVEQCERSRRILEQYAHFLSVQAGLDRAAAAQKVLPHLAYRLLALMDLLETRDLAFSHAQLTRFLGMERRASVADALKTMIDAAFVEQRDRGLIVLNDLHELRGLAGREFGDLGNQRGLLLDYLREFRRVATA